MKTLSKKTVILLTLFVMLLWGSLFPFIKLGYREFSIDTSFIPNLLLFAGIRFTICGCIIVLASGLKNRSVPKFSSKKEWIFTALVGLIAVMLHYACTYIGLSMVDSSKTALLKQSGVLLFICVSFLFVKEDTFTIGKLFGAIFGLLSIVLLNYDALEIRLSFGEILIVLASLCTVSSNLICKKALVNTNPICITGYSELFGGVLLLVIGFAFGGRLNAVSWKGALVFLYIIVATVISYGLWYWLVQKSDLSNLFIIKLSEPLFTAAIGMLVLGENIWKWQYFASVVCIAAAMIISNVKFKRKVKKDA